MTGALKTHAVRCIEEGRLQDWWLFKAMIPEGKVSNDQTVDVEACVRLLTRVAFLIERVGFDLDIAEMVGQEPEEENPPEDINLIEAEQQGQADSLRALASALPGTGKDSERPCPECHHPVSKHAPFGCSHETGHFTVCGCRARLADDADPRLIPAARAAQPQETSADERP